MSNKLNIIFICNELPPGNTGGVGIFVKELTSRLALNGHKLIILGFLDKVEKKEAFYIDGVMVIKLPSSKGRFSFLLDRLCLYREVKDLASKFPINIVEAPDFEGWSAFLPKGTYKTVVRLHGSHTYFSKEMNEEYSFLIHNLEKIALKRADFIVSVSRYTANKTAEFFSLNKNIDVIHNGIDLPNISTYSSNCNGDYKVVFTGSLMKKKGVLSIAKAWPLVTEKFPYAELIMIGKDTLNRGKSVKAEIEEIVKDKSVSFLGHLPKVEMERIVSDCDIAIYPSYSETFGLAPIESMALGVPTIYTKLSCGPEIVKVKSLIDICVDPHNIYEVANTLIKLLSDSDYRCDIAKLGRKLVEENYSNDSKVIENELFYKRVSEDA